MPPLSPIIVYGKATCPTCSLAMRLMDRKGVEYEYRNVEQDQDAYARVQELGYLGVPVFEDGDKHSDFNPDWLNQAISARLA